MSKKLFKKYPTWDSFLNAFRASFGTYTDFYDETTTSDLKKFVLRVPAHERDKCFEELIDSCVVYGDTRYYYENANQEVYPVIDTFLKLGCKFPIHTLTGLIDVSEISYEDTRPNFCDFIMDVFNRYSKHLPGWAEFDYDESDDEDTSVETAEQIFNSNTKLIRAYCKTLRPEMNPILKSELLTKAAEFRAKIDWHPDSEATKAWVAEFASDVF